MLTIFGAPGRYIQGPDALDTLGRQAALFGRRAALVIDGPMHAILGARVEALCAASQVRAMPLIVEGDLTPETIERCARRPAGSTPTWSSRWAAARRWTPARRWRARCIAT